ncbi:MAG: thermonuclease family protein [Patescibacteria group bacterium]
MQMVLSFVRHIPGFRSSGHPIRKIAATIFYGFVLLVILASFSGNYSDKKDNLVSPSLSPQVESVAVQIIETTPPTSTPSSSLFIDAIVTNVIDGDTFTIEGGKVVRMIGIDTPETVHPSKPVQCYGKEASAKTTELIEGQKIRLEKDVSETDKYNRLLRYIWKGEVLINELLVKEGYAQSSSYPPDIKYQDRFVAPPSKRPETARRVCGVQLVPLLHQPR